MGITITNNAGRVLELKPLTQDQINETRGMTNKRPEILEKFLKRAPDPDIKFVPEYEYRAFIFSVPSLTSEYISLLAEQAKIASNILSASPDTTITFFTRDRDHIPVIRNVLLKRSPELADLVKQGRIKFAVTDIGAGDVWAQDWGEPTGGKGGSIVHGMVHEQYAERGWRRGAIFNGAQARNAGLMPDIEIPVVLQGGNFTKAVSRNGRKFVFVGSNDIIYTKDIYCEKYRYDISDQEIMKIYKTAFNADEIVVLGEGEKQPESMFHIDQAVFFPKAGTAVIVCPDDCDPASSDPEQLEIMRALDSYRVQLAKAGFEVIEIPTTFKNIFGFQAYTNSIAIQENGRCRVIMPSFRLRKQLESTIKAILAGHGIEVIYIDNHTYKDKGNTHCITGQISYFRPAVENPLT